MSQNTTLNLSLPTQLKEKAKKQAKACHFSSTSDYLQTLIRNDIEKTREKKKFESFLSQGINSGKSEKMTTKELDSWMTRIIDKRK